MTENNAAQPGQDPLSDEYVNAVIRQHGYGHPTAVAARLWQWIGLYGGENGVTLLMYEAHKALSKLRAPVADTYVEACECGACGHVGINDSSDTLAACKNCDWSGDSPKEDHCPGCAQVGTMTAACPKCGSQYSLLADRTISATLASAPVAGEAQPIGYVAARELSRLNSGHDANLRSAKFGPSALDGDVPVYLEPAKAGTDESAIRRALVAASNYIDTLGGDSRSYRAALASAPVAYEQETVHNAAIKAAAKVCADIARQYDPQNDQENALASELYSAGAAILKLVKEDRAALSAPQAEQGERDA